VNAVVVALGKIGLPIAVQIAGRGHAVVGCDIDERVVGLVNDGVEPFPGEAGLADGLRAALDAGRLRAQTDTTAAVAEGPDLVVCVPPLAVDGELSIDFGAVDAVCDAVGRGLRAGTTVSFETTLPVGTTRGRIAARLEELSGLAVDEDFFLVFSPERVYSGRIFRDLATYPKLVGGVGPASEARGVELYGQFLDAEVWPMGSAEAAELAKLAETTYRNINIAFANELARFADRQGIDLERVIEASNSQPFSHIHRPGVAVGGHCIPVYPHFYMSGDPEARLPRTADEVNRAMPAYAVDRLAAALGADGLAGARVLILGVTYRGGVKETAFSGAFPLRDDLSAAGATVLAADPLYSPDELRDLGFEPWDGTPIDAAILQADHAEYIALEPPDLPGLRALVDGRNALDPEPWRAAGVTVRRIGRP
jgi:UDP-N-acetyl-D-glucosamine dehydrogenase